jgi:hypothetical protein
VAVKFEINEEIDDPLAEDNNMMEPEMKGTFSREKYGN